jgi:hypothetical protein
MRLSGEKTEISYQTSMNGGPACPDFCFNF